MAPRTRGALAAAQRLLVFFVCGWTAAAATASQVVVADEDPAGAPAVGASAVVGGVARLPCDVSPPLPADAVYLVIWYKDGALSPVYSLDARGRPLHQARHWADDKALSGRAFFRYMDRPARLTIESARVSDGGVYRCRVDFKSSPTRNTRVDLAIIVPPEKVVILDDKGFHVPNGVLGPYDEEASPDIVCIVTGGRPPPKVTWWRDGLLVDDSFEALPGGRARNPLRLERLQRRDADAKLTCQASNNELVAPVTASVTIDLNLEPLWVRLLGEVRPLSADANQEVQCEVVGARPAPSVTWWLADAQLRNTRETTSRDRNVTTSTLTFVPSLEDSGKRLACRAGSPGRLQEDSWSLDVMHVPMVSLELGSNINASHIREGMDVYFDCSIKSNPWVYRVSWRHNGKPLSNNATAGTIVSNQSLVLQSVSRSRAGIYTCVASNQEGDGESNPVYLDIKYAPACRAGQQRVLSAARLQTARVVCLVDANPRRVRFSWRFDNGAEAVDVPPQHVASEGARSVASYVPVTALDYGTLLCSGRNEVGAQATPCAFKVVPAGQPGPPTNCTVANQTAEGVQVECSPGGDDPPPRLYVMEVLDSATGELLANSTAAAPSLHASGLPPGAGLNVSVYSADGRGGRSGAASLLVPAVRPQETRAGPDARPRPPARCSVARRTAASLAVACDPPPPDADRGATYLLQAFDAASRRLVGSATAPAASGRVELCDLPPAGSGALLLAVRTVTARATSDAVSIYAGGAELQQLQAGDADEPPLQLTPALGAAAGAAVTLLAVGAAVAATLRLRGGGAKAAAAAAAAAEAGAQPPAGKEQDDSIDDNNPDVVPQSSDKCHISDEEAFELRSLAPKIPKITFQSVHSPLQFPRREPFRSIPENEEQLVYVQLCQPRPVARSPGAARQLRPQHAAAADRRLATLPRRRPPQHAAPWSAGPPPGHAPPGPDEAAAAAAVVRTSSAPSPSRCSLVPPPPAPPPLPLPPLPPLPQSPLPHPPPLPQSPEVAAATPLHQQTQSSMDRVTR